MKKLADIVEGVGDCLFFLILLLFTPAFNGQNMGVCNVQFVDYVFYTIIIAAYVYMAYTMQNTRSKRKRITRMTIWYFVVGGVISLRLPFVEFPQDVVYLLVMWARIGIVLVVWIALLLIAYYIKTKKGETI